MLETFGNQTGEQHGDEAVEVCGPRADGDQREHVEVPGDDGPPATLEERPAAPQNHRRTEHKLQPGKQRGSQPAVHRNAEHRQHRQQQHRNGQNKADPKPASHAPQFRVVLFLIWLDGLRLQGHAALGACSGAVLLDLRVHWTGIDDLLLCGPKDGPVPGPCRTSGSSPACHSRRLCTSGRRICPILAASAVQPRDGRGRAAPARRFFHRRGTSAGNARCKSRRSGRPAGRCGRSLHPRSCRKWGQLP